MSIGFDSQDRQLQKVLKSTPIKSAILPGDIGLYLEKNPVLVL